LANRNPEAIFMWAANKGRQMLTIDEIRNGGAIRFNHRGEEVTGLKTVLPNNGDPAVLVLTPTKAGLRPGDLLSSFDAVSIIELPNVTIVPSTKVGTVTPGASNFAVQGEIERHGEDLIFVTRPQGETIHCRVNLETGATAFASGERPIEIYSEWSVVQANGVAVEVLYCHVPTPDSGGDTVTITLDN
jgi:hypothetical protein